MEFTRSRYRSFQWFFAIAFSGCWIGCGRQPEVSHYILPKHRSIQLDGESSPEKTIARPQGAPTHRMLASVTRKGDQAWFLKGMAPLDELHDGLRDQFVQLISTTIFSAETGQPSWQLPEGWQQEAGQGMRFANLRVGDLEFSVIPLPFPAGTEQEYLLSNVVRWRGQLRLPPVAADQLEKETQQIDLPGGLQAVLVDLRGWQGPRDTPQSSFAGNGAQLPADHPPVGNLPADHPPMGNVRGGAATDSKLDYQLPEGWRELPAGGMRKAAFQVSDGERKIEITVIDLAGGAGDLLANVNRWRKQIGLDELGSAAELESTRLRVDNKPATYVHLEGTREQAIWGVIVPEQDRVWFLKLTGDLQLARREESAFRSLVNSIRFGG